MADMTREHAREHLNDFIKHITNSDYPTEHKKDFEHLKEVFQVCAEALQEPEIVCCKDCKFWPNGFINERPCSKTGAYPMKADGWCSYGERRDKE